MSNTYLKDVTVLIVDDQEFIRSLIRQMLSVLGCSNILDATNGEDAWEICLHNTPDLIILDWHMAPMDGLEFLKKMRHDSESPNPYVPIIMISGYSERERIFAARDAGVNEFVVKPIAAKSLFSRINAVIEHPRRFVRVGEFFGPDRRRQQKDVKNDRRGEGGEEGGGEKSDDDPADPKEKMSQDEINDTMNPDDAAKAS